MLKTWVDGEFEDQETVVVPVLAHMVQYGDGIFEGERAYQQYTEDGERINGLSALFRLPEHTDRLINSANVYHRKLGFDRAQIIEATIATVKQNGLPAAYLRPFAGFPQAGIGIKLAGKIISLSISETPPKIYVPGQDEKGVTTMISSWRRPPNDVLPQNAKATTNYGNSGLGTDEASRAGFDEAIMLTHGDEVVAEGPGENIFCVVDSRLITPPTDRILKGITRDSVIKIAKDLGFTVEEREITPEELKEESDEVFFAGTAIQVAHIPLIDTTKIGDGTIGPVTAQLKEEFDKIVRGRNEKFADWLTPIRL